MYLCSMKLAVIGATGLIGQTMLKVLEERNFPLDELILVASETSVGKRLTYNGEQHELVSIEDGLNKKPDLALFSIKGDLSREWAPKFSEAGCTVIDNSSAWRMEQGIKLIVPEVNGKELKPEDKIISNPNCSTMQMVLALAPLHDKYKIKRIVISTYQSVTGTGSKAVEQLENERSGIVAEQVYPHPIDLNCFPHGGDFLDNGYTTEEQKLVDETRKILGDPTIQVSATVVRIPVIGGHSESVNVEFHNDFDLAEVRSLLDATEGVTVQDEPEKNLYPTPLMARGNDEVWVGRLRRDDTQANTLNLWIVSDNLRKGGATNTVQIAEYLLENKLLNGAS